MKKIFYLLMFVLFVFVLSSCELDMSTNPTYDFSEYVELNSQVITYDGAKHELTPTILKQLPDGYKIKAVTNTEFSEVGTHEVVYKVVDSKDNVCYIVNGSLSIEEDKSIPANEELNLRYELNLMSTPFYIWSYNETLYITLQQSKSYQTYKMDANTVYRVLKSLLAEEETANLADETLELINEDENNYEELLAKFSMIYGLLANAYVEFKNLDFKSYIDSEGKILKDKFFEDFYHIVEPLLSLDVFKDEKDKVEEIFDELEKYELSITLNEDDSIKLLLIGNQDNPRFKYDSEEQQLLLSLENYGTIDLIKNDLYTKLTVSLSLNNHYDFNFSNLNNEMHIDLGYGNQNAENNIKQILFNFDKKENSFAFDFEMTNQNDHKTIIDLELQKDNIKLVFEGYDKEGHHNLINFKYGEEKLFDFDLYYQGKNYKANIDLENFKEYSIDLNGVEIKLIKLDEISEDVLKTYPNAIPGESFIPTIKTMIKLMKTLM